MCFLHLSARTNCLENCMDSARARAAYNCRIVFSIDRDPRTGAEIVLLHNIGTHDQVY